MKEWTDSDRLDFLDSLTGHDENGGRVQLRLSTTGRGWRLHEGPQGYASVREAIDAFAGERPEDPPSNPARVVAFLVGVGLAVFLIAVSLAACPPSLQVLRDLCDGLAMGREPQHYSAEVGGTTPIAAGTEGFARGPLPHLGR